MKKLIRNILLLLFVLAGTPSTAQFIGCLPGFCSTPPATGCVNFGHATAFLARTSGLDGTHTTAYTDLLNNMDADGITCLFDFLYIPATQDSTTASLNLIKNNFNLVTHGAVTFTADNGYSGVNSSSTIYLDTGFNPTVESATSQFQQNNAHISVWNLTNATSAFPPFGGANNGIPNNTLIFPKFTDNNAYFRVNVNDVGEPQGVGTPLGHFLANHNSITNDCVHNGVNFASYIDTSQSVLNLNLVAAGFNNNGTIVGSGALTAAISGGKNLTPTQYLAFYTHLRAYMTAVGVP